MAPQHSSYELLDEESQRKRKSDAKNGPGGTKRFGSIGWQTPVAISLSYLSAVLFALIHFLYCRAVHNKLITETLSQSWNNALAVIFAQGYSIALAAAGTQAFTQILWWYLRRRPMSVSKIDALFHLNFSALYMWRVDLLAVAPLLWFFALFFPMIAVATAFPPGALVVQQLPRTRVVSGQVPTLDVRDWGNGSVDDFYRKAMYNVDEFDGGYWDAKSEYIQLGKRTVLLGEISTRPSPCGPNCTYSLEFTGPSLTCKDKWVLGERKWDDIGNIDVNGVSEPYNTDWALVNDFEYIGAWVDPFNFTLSAELGYSVRQNSTLSPEARARLPERSLVGWNETDWKEAGLDPMNSSIRWDMYYKSDGGAQQGQTIGCVAANSTYVANVTYINNVQTYEVEVKNKGNLMPFPLNSELKTFLNDALKRPDRLLLPEKLNSSYQVDWRTEFPASFQANQLMAIADSFLIGLTGTVHYYWPELNLGTHVEKTIINESPFASPQWNDTMHKWDRTSYAQLTPAVLEELMQNVTMSMLSHSSQLTTTTANTLISQTTLSDGYVFEAPNRLLVAYFSGLALYSVLITLGVLALLHNGVAASPGGFLEVLGATAASGSQLNGVVRQVNQGERPLRQLLDLRIRLGEVRDDGGGETPFAAFGTEGETVPLRRMTRGGLSSES